MHTGPAAAIARPGTLDCAGQRSRPSLLAHRPKRQRCPVLPPTLRKYAPLFPLPSGPVSGLEVWSNDPIVLQRFTDRQRPLEAEWMLSVPITALDSTLTKLQSWQVRCSISQRQTERGSLRIITPSPEAPGWLTAIAASLPNGTWQLRRQRIGQKSLHPLTTGGWRLMKFGEKF